MVKNPLANAGDMKSGFDLRVGKIPWRRAWQPTPVFLLGESHAQRSLVGYSPEGHKESDMTEVTEHAHSGRNKDLVVLVKGESYRSVEHNREARSRSIQICPNGF